MPFISCYQEQENVIPELIIDVPDQIKPEISSIILRVKGEDVLPIEIDLARPDEDLVIPTGKDRVISVTVLNGQGEVRATGTTFTDISSRNRKVVLNLSLPPQSPVLQPIARGDEGLKLVWDRYPEQDSAQVFKAYLIYRNTFSSVSEISEMVKQVDDVKETEYTDTDLLDGQEYFYRVYVYTESGAFNASNLEKATYRKSGGQLSWNGTCQP